MRKLYFISFHFVFFFKSRVQISIKKILNPVRDLDLVYFFLGKKKIFREKKEHGKHLHAPRKKAETQERIYEKKKNL